MEPKKSNISPKEVVMAVMHTQPRADRSTISDGTVKSHSEASKAKPWRSRMVRKLVKPHSEEIIPVFVGLAG